MTVYGGKIMAIVQDSFFIPDDIATGLATGLYRRIGSVVRYAVGPNKGQIVKHLQPVNIKTAEQAQGVGSIAFQFVKQHKKGTVITLLGAAAIGAGIWIYHKAKNYEPKVVTQFRASLRDYIDAISKGNLDISTINSLLENLEALKQHKDYEKIQIQMTTEDLEVLVNRICEYTRKLAQDNQVALTSDEMRACDKQGGALVHLQTYLEAQKRIFETVA